MRRAYSTLSCVLICAVGSRRGRPVGDRPQVTNRKYYIDKRVRDACERWSAGYDERQRGPRGPPAVKTEAPPTVNSVAPPTVKTEGAVPVELPTPIEDTWWADEGESSDSYSSSIEEGEVTWAPADAYGELARPGMMDWDSSNMNGAGIDPVGLNDSWMQWLPPAIDDVQHALGASVQVPPKRAHSPEQAAPQKQIKTELNESVRPQAGTSVARGAVKFGLAFLAVCAVTYVVVSRSGRLPGERPSDGWNCEHTGDNTIIMFGGREEFCAANRDAMFPCAFECPAGSIGVGRSCRCDGCYRDGQCMHWMMDGHSPNQYNESVAGCPEPTVVNSNNDSTVAWPAWWQTPDKVPGVPNQGGAMWHDNSNNRLVVTLFPAGSTCPDEKCARLVARGARSFCSDALGACPLDGSESVAGVWSWDLSDNSTYLWTRVIDAGDLGSSPSSRNNALAFKGASSFFIFGGRSWIESFEGSGFEKKDDRCISDMWVLTSSDRGADSKWTQLSAGMDSERHLVWNHTDGKQPQWPAGSFGRTAWSAPCEPGADSGCTERLWMFGGQADEEVGPVNALWVYEYRRPEELGTWTLVTGSTYDMVEYTLTEKLQPTNQIHDLYDNLQAVDPCLSSWPLENRRVAITNPNGTVHYELQLHWIKPGEARCPAARYAAASWSAADSQLGGGGGAYVFGGLTVWQPSLEAEFSRWKNQSRSWIPDDAINRVRALQDLWHFNGNLQNPRWTQVHQSQTAWPPAAIGHGWEAAGQLWLWVSWVGPQRECISANCSNPASTYRYVNTDAANELWVFSPRTGVWERVTQSGVDDGNLALGEGTRAESSQPLGADVTRGGSGTKEFGAWPGARQGELMDGGYLFSGLGNHECVSADGAHQAPGDAFTRPLSGLWRWTPRDD